MVSERVLAELWGRRLWEGRWLRAADGRLLRLVWSGEPAQHGGPDFRGAIVDFGSGRVRGDVELDLLAGLWRAHGHHRDPHFNGVVLHAVLSAQSSSSTALQSGVEVPILPLGDYLPVAPGELEAWGRWARFTACPCRCDGSGRRCGRRVRRVIADAGDGRFQEKGVRLRAALEVHSPDLLMFTGMMRSLGYPGHSAQFERLVGAVPLAPLLQTDEWERQSLLLGRGGLLPSQRGLAGIGADVGRMERLWAEMALTAVMSESDWALVRLRPAGFPARRLAAVSSILERYRAGLFAGLAALVEAASSRREAGIIERGLMVGPCGYWADHFDFGRAMPRRCCLLGRGAARTMAVNVVLPLVWAWAGLHGDRRLARAARGVYSRYPALPENHITRRMKKQLFPGGGSGPRSARAHQGMLHLYKEFCTMGRGELCPLAAPRAAFPGRRP